MPSYPETRDGRDVMEAKEQSMEANKAKDAGELSAAVVDERPLLLMGPFPASLPAPRPISSALRPGSRFKGTQRSEKATYQVMVDIKDVDLDQSYLCGYLRIQGLTPDNPTLTTFFQGEIIGPKYGYSTMNPEWGASDEIDSRHWTKFAAFQNLPRPSTTVDGVIRHDNVFMRWKELFLVPDHSVPSITGASFEGFYYICFNQPKREVNGIYFHSKSEKFQQLTLHYIDNVRTTPALQFR